MQKFLLVSLFVLSFVCNSFLLSGVCAKASDEPVQSTQGLQLDESVAKSKPTSEQKNEQKQSKNRLNKYIKTKKQIRKQNAIRDTKLKQLEYLERRLEAKQKKLESLGSDTEKGEKE